LKFLGPKENAVWNFVKIKNTYPVPGGLWIVANMGIFMPLLKNEWVDIGDPAPPHRRGSIEFCVG
jgi:hypothetical protein